MNIRWLNRYNVCEMEGFCVETGRSFTRDGGKYPCFRAAFSFVDSNKQNFSYVKYTLYIKNECDGHNNNFKILDTANILRLLHIFQQIIPFKFKFNDCPQGIFSTVNLELSGTRAQHKALLMLVRTLFEYPHNMCAMDALKLRDEHIPGINMKKFSIISLYMLCLSAVDFSTDESIISHDFPKLMKMCDLKREYSRRNRATVSAVIKKNLNYHVRKMREPDTLEKLISEEGYFERKQIYIENIKNYLEINENHLLPKVFNRYGV